MNKKNIINQLSRIVLKKDIIIDDKELSKYNKDWRGFYNFKSICIIFPRTTKQISTALNFCFKNNIKVVPQGGNTSLTGAAVPSKDNYEVIINFRNINKILSLDKKNMLVEVESGVILENLKKYVNKKGFYFPLSLSSSGSCLIGGNIATNAGGINALKYGNVRESIQGLEVVLADGSIIEEMSTMKKIILGTILKIFFVAQKVHSAF